MPHTIQLHATERRLRRGKEDHWILHPEPAFVIMSSSKLTRGHEADSRRAPMRQVGLCASCLERQHVRETTNPSVAACRQAREPRTVARLRHSRLRVRQSGRCAAT